MLTRCDPNYPRVLLFLAITLSQVGEKAKGREFPDKAVQWLEKTGREDEELSRFLAEEPAMPGVKKKD